MKFYMKEPIPIKFTVTEEYRSANTLAGTQSIEDLLATDTKIGICSNAPGMILFELNDVWEIEDIDVCGLSGCSIWQASHGKSASISTSIDGKNFKVVGSLPSNFSSLITTIKLARSKAKFLKFESKELLGLGHLKIKKMLNQK